MKTFKYLIFEKSFMDVSTRYRSVERKENSGKIEIIHEIDQFSWFRNGMSRALTENEEESEEEILGKENPSDRKLFSAVRFHLPYCPGREAPHYLVVAGNGLDRCNAYLVRVNWGRDMLTGNIPKQESRLWKLYSYLEGRGDIDLEFKDWEKAVLLHNIFSTDIAPFLSDLRYPRKDHSRVFDIWCSYSSFDKLRITAECKNKSEELRLKVSALLNRRETSGEIIELRRTDTGWYSSRLEKLASTDSFSFATVI